MPMWVRPEFRAPAESETGGVVFIGSHDLLREDLLGSAVEFGLPVAIFGAGWSGGEPSASPRARSLRRTLANQAEFLGKEGIRGFAMRATYSYRKRRQAGWMEGRVNPPLAGDRYFEATREAQVVIGVNRYPSFRRRFSNPHRYSRLRDIEGPMLGACYLTEMAPGIEDLYDVGKEIEVYGDARELAEKAAVLQADPQRRRRLRKLGQKRALADHSIARSLERIAEKLGIPAR
jgi:Glycosyl transferases group 1